MREAWKGETYVRSQSFSSESAVKYLHVGRRKIQISPPPGEQDQSNALPQGQQRQSNPPPMPYLPPAGFTLIGALRWLDWVFKAGNRPSLSINYVGMSKDMGKRLPQN